MKRSILFLTIFFAASFGVFAQSDNFTVDLVKERAEAEKLARSDVKLSPTYDEHGRTFQGGFYGGSGYQFPDSETVQTGLGNHKTSKAARELLQKQIKNAFAIIEHIKPEPKKGKPYEETILFVEKKKDHEKKDYYVYRKISIINSLVFEISSSSLKHLLAYELIEN